MSLDPRVIEALQEIIDKNSATTIKSINAETLTAIEKWPALVTMLEDFLLKKASLWLGNQLQESIDFGYIYLTDKPNSYYDPRSHELFLSTSVFDLDMSFRGEQQYKAIAHLAHELTHAFQKSNEDPYGRNYSNAADYAAAGNANEGEAFYNEMVALYRIYGALEDGTVNEDALEVFRKKLMQFGFWDDNEASSTDVLSRFERIFDIVQPDLFTDADGDPDKARKIAELARLNEDMVGIEMNAGGVPLTYNENYRWYWLQNNTDLAIDLMEALTSNIYSREPSELADSRRQAARDLLASDEYSFYIKTLVNKANNSGANKYLGLDDANPENLNAAENGSVLGSVTDVNRYPFGTITLEKKYSEVLWGGGGADTVRGSNQNDLLLGGDGADKLYGNAGADRLAGNEGDDTLDGGANDDELIGGIGRDKYIIGEGSDTITDSDKNGEIYHGKGGPQLVGGKMVQVNGIGNNIYRSADKRYEYVFRPNPSDGPESTIGTLDIYELTAEGQKTGGLLATINDFSNPALSGSLQPNGISTRAPGNNNLGLVFEVEEKELPAQHGITSQTYDRITMRAGGNVDTGMLSDYVTGSAFDDVISLGEGNSEVALGNGGDDFIDGGSGNGTLNGGMERHFNVGNNSHGQQTFSVAFAA